MRQITYQAVFEPAEGNGFSVYFPDLPGCTSYGETLSDAQKNARDALGLHLYGLERDGDQIPAPSDTPDIDPETAKGHLVRPVSVFLLDYKGYTAQPEYSAEDHIFYGTILGISDAVDFQPDSAKDLEEEFHKAVDDYLEFCKEIGKTPAKADKRETLNHFLSLFPEEGLDLDPEQVREERRLRTGETGSD